MNKITKKDLKRHSLDSILTKAYGKKGTPKREAAEHAIKIREGSHSKRIVSKEKAIEKGKEVPDGFRTVGETSDGNLIIEATYGCVIICKEAIEKNNIYTITGTPKQIASALNHVIGGGVNFADGAVVKMAKK